MKLVSADERDNERKGGVDGGPSSEAGDTDALFFFQGFIQASGHGFGWWYNAHMRSPQALS